MDIGTVKRMLGSLWVRTQDSGLKEITRFIEEQQQEIERLRGELESREWVSIKEEKPPAGLTLVNRCRMFVGEPINETIILEIKESWTKEDLLGVWDRWQPLPEATETV